VSCMTKGDWMGATSRLNQSGEAGSASMTHWNAAAGEIPG